LLLLLKPASFRRFDILREWGGYVEPDRASVKSGHQINEALIPKIVKRRNSRIILDVDQWLDRFKPV
jgi:hypothetical protein